MAAAATSAAFKRLDLRDPAALFETHGAEEIRGLERQVRAEIEHKKEELRQMVGERYRDLIEAADTIGQMRRCAEGLVDAVKATDQYCARLRQAGSAAPRPPRDPQVSPGPRSPRAQPHLLSGGACATSGLLRSGTRAAGLPLAADPPARPSGSFCGSLPTSGREALASSWVPRAPTSDVSGKRQGSPSPDSSAFSLCDISRRS